MNLPFGFTYLNLRSRACGVAAAALLTGMLTSSAAWAEPTEAAREASKQAFVEARKLWDSGDFLEACRKFEESYQHAPSVGNLLNLGRCAERGGKLATAQGYYQRSAEMADAQGQAERAQAARDLMSALKPRLSKVAISVEPKPEGLEVTLDGQPVSLDGGPVPLDPGEHRIAAYAPGYERSEQALEVQAEGELRTVELTLTKLPGGPGAPVEERGPGLMIGGIAAIGVGAVGLVLGGVFGSMALSEEDKLEENCSPEGVCPEFFVGTTDPLEVDAIKSDARQNATISTASFAVGGALVGVGLTLVLVDVLTREDGTPSDDVVFLPYLSPEGAGAGMHLRF